MLFRRYANRRVLRTLVFLLFDRFYIAYWVCWLMIRYSRKSDAIIPYLNNWLTDLLFLPVILHTAACLAYWLFRQTRFATFPLWMVFIAAAYVSVFYEYVAPRITDYNTADWLDVLCYFLGAWLYINVHQPYFLKRITQYQELKKPSLS